MSPLGVGLRVVAVMDRPVSVGLVEIVVRVGETAEKVRDRVSWEGEKD